MTSPLHIAVIQLSYDDAESVQERTARVGDLVRAAAAGRPEAGGQRLVVLPELWPQTGFGHEHWEERAEPLDGPTARAMSALAAECGVMLHAGSIVERLPAPGAEGKSLANTSLFFGADGQLAAVYRKIHRFGFGSVEPSVMEAGDQITVVELESGHRVGLSTCYDLRFPELYRRQLDAGAQVFIVPAAWPRARVEAWRLLGQARAVENQAVVVTCNTAGTHAGVEMGGHSAVVSATGEVVAEAGLEEEVIEVTVDLDEVATARDAFPVLADRRL
ncbi:MAG: carbon-nitrogen family hydrolase [Actinomycetia bacterium]|nr:carbon-nitrogen family hydrolase [Actinomycetes bacterium]